MITKLRALLILPILTFLFCGLNDSVVLFAQESPQKPHQEMQRFEFEGIEMAVPIRIVLYAADADLAKRAADAALGRFHDLNARLSDYDENSEVRRFCDFALPGEFFHASDDLWTVLKMAVHYAELSDGAFDPTVGQVVRLWRHARKSKRFPPEKRIQETLTTVGWQNILFDEKTQAIGISENGTKNNVRIDLGGIAKGYAIDEALKTMRILGVTRVLLDAGGDLGLGDAPPEKEGWTIAVTPVRKGEKPTEFLTLHHCGVANSGDMYQFVEIDGRRYSHIVDPKTGLGLTTRLTVSVIAPTAAEADALASAISVLGPEKGLKLADSLENVRAQILKINDDETVSKFGF